MGCVRLDEDQNVFDLHVCFSHVWCFRTQQTVDDLGRTALHLACDIGDDIFEIVEELVQATARLRGPRGAAQLVIAKHFVPSYSFDLQHGKYVLNKPKVTDTSETSNDNDNASESFSFKWVDYEGSFEDNNNQASSALLHTGNVAKSSTSSMHTALRLHNELLQSITTAHRQQWRNKGISTVGMGCPNILNYFNETLATAAALLQQEAQLLNETKGDDSVRVNSSKPKVETQQQQDYQRALPTDDDDDIEARLIALMSANLRDDGELSHRNSDADSVRLNDYVISSDLKSRASSATAPAKRSSETSFDSLQLGFDIDSNNSNGISQITNTKNNRSSASILSVRPRSPTRVGAPIPLLLEIIGIYRSVASREKSGQLWFYRDHNDKVHGPFSTQQVLYWVRRGMLRCMVGQCNLVQGTVIFILRRCFVLFVHNRTHYRPSSTRYSRRSTSFTADSVSSVIDIFTH